MLTLESYIAMIAAAAKDMGDAIIKLMPLFIIFSLFNGFFITKVTAACSWLQPHTERLPTSAAPAAASSVPASSSDPTPPISLSPRLQFL